MIESSDDWIIAYIHSCDGESLFTFLYIGNNQYAHITHGNGADSRDRGKREYLSIYRNRHEIKPYKRGIANRDAKRGKPMEYGEIRHGKTIYTYTDIYHFIFQIDETRN